VHIPKKHRGENLCEFICSGPQLLYLGPKAVNSRVVVVVGVEGIIDRARDHPCRMRIEFGKAIEAELPVSLSLVVSLEFSDSVENELIQGEVSGHFTSNRWECLDHW
jgi:hypothetical protein